jgi:hypothetical protein
LERNVSSSQIGADRNSVRIMRPRKSSVTLRTARSHYIKNVAPKSLNQNEKPRDIDKYVNILEMQKVLKKEEELKSQRLINGMEMKMDHQRLQFMEIIN